MFDIEKKLTYNVHMGNKGSQNRIFHNNLAKFIKASFKINKSEIYICVIVQYVIVPVFVQLILNLDFR